MSLSTILILLVPPLMWAGNAIVGHYAADLVPPMLFNLVRWMLVFIILLPMAGWVLKSDSPIWRRWKFFLIMGFLSVSLYNSFQYLALHTSSPINVTLIAAGMPVWMILVGALFFKAPATLMNFLGATSSIAGVLLVLSRGDPSALLAFKFVPGDLYILIAILGWSIYSWMLSGMGEPQSVRKDWAALLLVQVFFGLFGAALFTAVETVAFPQEIKMGWPLLLILIYVALGPAILAYRAWGEAVQRVGPTITGFFANLTPLFAAVMSSIFLGEYPQVYHLIAFVLIVGGIWLSALSKQTVH